MATSIPNKCVVCDNITEIKTLGHLEPLCIG